MPESRALVCLACLLLTALQAEAELADPMRPSWSLPAGPAAEMPSGALRVSAVFISGERRIAVVNGQRVRVGDSVAGAYVSRIERDRVGFRRGDEAFSVPLLAAAARQ